MRPQTTFRVLALLLVGLLAGLWGGASLLARAPQPDGFRIEHVNPNALFGLSDAVVAHTPAARFIFLSGQVGIGPEGAPDDLAAQAELAFANVARQLKDAGAGPQDVVKINAYIRDMDLEKAQIVGAAKRKHFTAKGQPASTWVGVTSLVMSNLLVEVEVIAVVAH